jgi:hypothetical protein
MNKNNEWIYPISLEYRKNWDKWEAIREITQNMMDTCNNFQITKNSRGLLLKDFGTGLKRKHLILGVSEKDEDARGKFGEGLKFALVVLKRLGYDIVVKSRNLKILVNTIEIEGERCLKLLLDENPNDVDVGTEIFIEGYNGETFEENFVRNNNKRIIFKSNNGQIIDEVEKKLYVKDIFVCHLKNARYSYNLPNIELSEDRNIPSEYSLNSALGKLYSVVDNKNIIDSFFDAMDRQLYEEDTDIAYTYIEHKAIWKEVFKEHYGQNAVIGTNEEWSREAQWRGAKVVNLPHDISTNLKDFIETDKQYVVNQNEQERVIVDENKLTDSEWNNLDILKQLSSKINGYTQVKVAIQEDPACYVTGKNLIYINREELLNLQKCLGHLVHELAHTTGADDMTKQMINEIGRVSGKLLFGFVNEHMEARNWARKRREIE